MIDRRGSEALSSVQRCFATRMGVTYEGSGMMANGTSLGTLSALSALSALSVLSALSALSVLAGSALPSRKPKMLSRLWIGCSKPA